MEGSWEQAAERHLANFIEGDVPYNTTVAVFVLDHIDAHIQDHSTRLHPVRPHKLWLAHCNNQKIRSPAIVRTVSVIYLRD